MSVIPDEGRLVIRRVPFEFPDDLHPIWNPGQREWSHMVNGVSLVMPFLEPFLIATMREALKEVDDEVVREEARGFAAQEANHFKTHRRYNELLKSNGYPELAAVESAMADSYDRIRKNRSLAFRMAYACGFESMTIAVTSWLVDNRVELFGGSDTRVASFILWHFVEECEHKRVAFDVYQASIGSYWQRALGVFTGSLHVVWWARKACLAMLRVDGQGSNPRSRLRLWRRTAQFARAVLPGALRSALPLHNPRNESDPQWVRDWIAGYDRSDPMLHVPLVDTADPVMPVPFPSTGR